LTSKEDEEKNERIKRSKRGKMEGEWRRGRRGKRDKLIEVSEEIIRNGLLGYHSSRILGSSLEYFEILVQKLIKLENGSHIATSVAIIWSRPDRDKRLVEHVFVTLHHKLVSSTDKCQLVGRVELSHNITAKKITGTSWAHSPAFNIFRIRPQEITHGSIVRYFLLSINCSDLIKSRD
jgi:hypothetical protein